MSPIRLARIVTRLNLGGPARQILAMTERLKERGFETHVLAGPPIAGEGSLEDEVVAAGAVLHRIEDLVREPRPFRDRRARRTMIRVLRSIAPHLVHTHLAKAGWLGRSAARAVGDVPTVHTFHGHLLEGYFQGWRLALYRFLERRACRATDRIVCVSERTLDDLVDARIVPPERCGIIRPGLDLSPFLAVSNEPFRDAVTTLGFVGRLVPIKAPMGFLDVVASLRARGRDVRAVMVGDGPLAAAVDAGIEERGLAGVVARRGLIQDMATFHRDVDLLCVTSLQEGLPVAVIEAAASGRPTVGFAVGGLEEIVIPERTGHLAPPQQTNVLVRWIEAMLDAPAEARAMGQRARTRVRETHSAERLARAHEELYRSLLSSRGGAP